MLLPIPLFAQIQTGPVVGVALDAVGNTVAGATITVCPQGSSGIPCSPVTASGISNGQGAFAVIVPLGTYTVTVFRSGIVATSSTVVVAPSNITGGTTPINLPNIIYTGSTAFPSTAAGINTADLALGPSAGSIIVSFPGSYCDTTVLLSNNHTLNFTAGTYFVNIAGADSSTGNVTWAVEGIGAGQTILKACPASGKDVITDQNFSSFTGGTNGFGVFNPVIRELTLDGSSTSPYGIRLYGFVRSYPNVIVQNTVTGTVWVEQNGRYNPTTITSGFNGTGTSPLFYGAKCDGVTDDTLAFQDMFRAVAGTFASSTGNTRGATIWMPSSGPVPLGTPGASGPCVIASAQPFRLLQGHSGLVFRGAGRDVSRIKFTYNVAAPTTTAAAVASNVATLTFTSIPASFAVNQVVLVTGFTGADTYFNGDFIMTGVTGTTITYALTHANASATSNGTASNAFAFVNFEPVDGTFQNLKFQDVGFYGPSGGSSPYNMSFYLENATAASGDMKLENVNIRGFQTVFRTDGTAGGDFSELDHPIVRDVNEVFHVNNPQAVIRSIVDPDICTGSNSQADVFAFDAGSAAVTVSGGYLCTNSATGNLFHYLTTFNGGSTNQNVAIDGTHIELLGGGGSTAQLVKDESFTAPHTLTFVGANSAVYQGSQTRSTGNINDATDFSWYGGVFGGNLTINSGPSTSLTAGSDRPSTFLIDESAIWLQGATTFTPPVLQSCTTFGVGGPTGCSGIGTGVSNSPILHIHGPDFPSCGGGNPCFAPYQDTGPPGLNDWTLSRKILALNVGGVTNSTGLQLFNTTTSCTTAATINTPCTTAAITLPVAYADTNYRLSCQGLGPTNFPQLQTVTKSNTTFIITLNNLTAAAATYASFDCSALHN